MWRSLAFCLLILFTATAASPAGSYLVLPFYNISENANLDWVGESLAESVWEALASFDVAVASREDREEAARQLSIRPAAQLTRASLIKLGQMVGAENVVHGRFEFLPDPGALSPSGGSLTIRAYSISLDGLSAGPEWQETGSLDDLSKLQTHLAWEVLGHAAAGAAPSLDEFVESHPPTRIDARENYVRGLLAPDLDEKHRFFTLAVNLEPEFSQASYQLGRLQWEDSSYRVAAGWLERVKPSDAHYLEANFLLGLCRYRSGDYPGAQAAFDLVARSAATADVYNNLGLALFRMGDPGAIKSLLWAVQREPDDQDLLFNTGYVLWRQGDLDGAVERFRKVLELDPRDVDAEQLLERCLNGSARRPGDLSGESLERLKENLVAP